jgi:hypothetical protein
MLHGVQACIEHQCLVSSVTLMLTTIDALAALTRPINLRETNGAIFRAWLTRFLHPKQRLNCSVEDLWGARCGVLHTYSPEAIRAADAGARRVYYQWRQGPVVGAIRVLPANSIIVIIEDLHEALIDAVQSYLVEIPSDSNLQASLRAHLPSLLCYVPYDPRPTTNA